MDETLIQSKFFDSNSESSDSDGDYIPDDIMSKHPNFKYSMGIIKGKFTEEYIIYHRPFLKELLDYCYKNYNVSIWTAATADYCKMVLKAILTKEQFNKTLKRKNIITFRR